MWDEKSRATPVASIGASDVLTVTKPSAVADDDDDDSDDSTDENAPAEYDPDAIATDGEPGATVTALTPDDVDAIAEYPAPFGDGPVGARARAYLHANCAGCHRPSGGASRAEIDLRFSTSFARYSLAIGSMSAGISCSSYVMPLVSSW